MTTSCQLLAGKVVVVSGVGPGLGRALAVRSAREGAAVVLAARNVERLEQIADEIRAFGGRAEVAATDLTNETSVRELVAHTTSTLGRVDALLHNGFVMPAYGRLLDADLGALRGGMDINLLAALDVTRQFAPALTETGGAVVMINSMVLRNQLPNLGAYRVMKAGLLALARSLSVELGPLGVRVNSVAPGYIWADSVKALFDRQAAARGVTPQQVYEDVAAGTDLRRLPEPDDIANAVVFLASEHARAITGQCLDVNCGQTHH